MAARANEVFSPDKVGVVVKGHFAQGQDLVLAAQAYGIAKPPTQNDDTLVLRKLPLSMQETIRAVIYANLDRPAGEQRYSIQFAWAPGSDYELTIWETPADPKTAGSVGGITILLKTTVPPPKATP